MEDKLKEYEIHLSNIKQQNANLHYAINSKEEKFSQFEDQFSECKQKLKESHEEIMRLEDRISLISNESNNLRSEKEDLENKVQLTLFIYCFTKVIINIY